MKNLYLHIVSIGLALFTGATVAAQDAAICTPFDTTGCVLDLEVAGDVFAGYRLKGFPRENYPDTLRQRYFHLDPFGKPVRQIVVTKEKWWNCPEDLLVNAEDVAYHGFRYSLKLMVYTDDTGQEYMTVARNPTPGADYTRCKTDGRYDCRMIGVNKEEERHWMEKSKSVYPWINTGL